MAKAKSPSITTACKQCHCRKIKCDKIRPACGTCQKNGLECFFIQGTFRRGPKKGELGRLKAQVATLEQQLAARQMGDQRNTPESPETRPIEVAITSSESGLEIYHDDDNGSGLLAEADQDFGQGWEPLPEPNFMEWLDLTLSSQNLGFQAASPIPSLPLNPMVQAGLALDKLLKADLEATFFERAHPFMPMLQRNRFHSWVDLDMPTPSQACLRSAVWTLAAALCPRFQDMYESLYAQTRQLLHTLEGGDQAHLWAANDADLEQIQAWLIVGHCEFIRAGMHVAIHSAARPLRLVLSARLNYEDAVDPSSDTIRHLIPPSQGSYADVSLKEERGRTFWVAFCFDRMINTLDHCLFTLQEESAHLRLPSSESAFEACEPGPRYCLADALRSLEATSTSDFAESLTISTIYGRCLTHRRLAAISSASGKANGNVSPGTLDKNQCLGRHNWLTEFLDTRLRSYARHSVPISRPLHVLTRLLSFACVVHLLETSIEHIGYDEEQLNKTYDAIVSMTQLASTLPQASCFNMHPFVPVILLQAVRCLRTYKYAFEKERDAKSVDYTARLLLSQVEKFEDVHVVAKQFLSEFRNNVI